MNKFQPQLQFVVQNSDIANVMVQRHKERINADLASVKQKIKLGQNDLERLNKEWHIQAKETWTAECGKPIAKAMGGLKSLFGVKFEIRYGRSKERSSYSSDRNVEVCRTLVESTEICEKRAVDYHVRSTSDLRMVAEKDCKPFVRPDSVRVLVHYWSEEACSRTEDLHRILEMKKGVYSFEFTPELQAKWDEIAEKTVTQLDLYRQRNDLVAELEALPEFEKQVQARLTAQAMSNMGGMPMLAALDASLSRPLLGKD